MDRKILLGDDHLITRRGLKTLFECYFGNAKVTEAASCSEIMNRLLREKYSHAVLDIVLADGSILEVLPNIVGLYPKLKILVFSMQPVSVYWRALKQYGIEHFVSKSSLEDETILQFSKFLNNEKPVSQDILSDHPSNPFSTLTTREFEILHYVLKGLGTSEIKNILNIQVNTISTFKARIFDKTNTRNIKELLDLATVYHIC